MITEYDYCGISECGNGSKRVWGAARWVENGIWAGTWIFWGSPANPQIKKYVGHSRMPKSERLVGRIAEKRKPWSQYTEIKSEDVKTVLPEIESQIGMHILARKLKYARV